MADSIERAKNLYRSDVHWLAQTFGVDAVRGMVDELMSEVVEVPVRERLRPRGLSDEDMNHIADTWGVEVQHG